MSESEEHVYEGIPVSDFQAKLPAVTVDCDYYKSGTILRLAVEVRVKGVGHDEDKEGNYVRMHKLGVQDIEVVSAYHPSEARDSVGGSAAGGAINAPAPDEDLGLSPGTTADQWPSGVARTPDGKLVDTETGEVVEEVVSEDIPEPEKDEASEPEPEKAEPESEEKADPEPAERETVDVGF